MTLTTYFGVLFVFLGYMLVVAATKIFDNRDSEEKRPLLAEVDKEEEEDGLPLYKCESK